MKHFRVHPSNFPGFLRAAGPMIYAKNIEKHQKMTFLTFLFSKKIQAVPVRVLHGYYGYLDPGLGLYPCSTRTQYP